MSKIRILALSDRVSLILSIRAIAIARFYLALATPTSFIFRFLVADRSAWHIIRDETEAFTGGRMAGTAVR